MQDLLKNKLFVVVAILLLVNVGVFFGSKVIINRTADKVIDKLQKEYSPSPYGPGVDPDRLSPNKRLYYELHQSASRASAQQEVQYAPTLQSLTKDADSWRDGWEKERGFSAQH